MPGFSFSVNDHRFIFKESEGMERQAMLFPIICFAGIFLNERLIAFFLFFDDAWNRKILPTMAAPPAEANTINGAGLSSPISFSTIAKLTPIKAAIVPLLSIIHATVFWFLLFFR